MTASPSRAVAPVSAVRATFRAQPSAYPQGAGKSDVAPTCGGRCGNGKRRRKPPADGFRRRKEPQAAKQEKTLALFCAGLTTSARSAGSFGG